MSRLFADIHKITEDFELKILIESDAKRIGVLGASGSGKSMTLRSITGIEDGVSGRIEVDGRTLLDSSKGIDLKPQQRRVGYMFQNYALFPTMNVQDNVMAGLKGSRDENRARAHEMLARFGMAEHAEKLPGELSGGQQQRVALARIMVTEPDLILLDEPLSALDGYLRERMQAEMMQMLDDYRGQVIMVSHSRDELYRFSEEIFVLSDGRIIRNGDAKDVFEDPGSDEAARLTGGVNYGDAASRVNINRAFGEEKSMSEFTHFDKNGNAYMVDVSDKNISRRTAVAKGTIKLSEEAMAAVLGNKIKKGDVLTVAQVAGIMGSKKTAELIPMCHPLSLTNSKVTFEIDEEDCEITAFCTAATEGRTGVEMEALLGVSTALLTIYDMCKAIDKGMIIGDICLVSKKGGKSDIE